MFRVVFRPKLQGSAKNKWINPGLKVERMAKLAQLAIKSQIESLSVLCVDGDWFSQRMTRSVLSNLEVSRITLCMDAAEALLTLEGLNKSDQNPDLILLDHDHKVDNNLAFLRRLRSPESPFPVAIPVIIMAEKAALKSTDTLKSLGISGILSKPLKLSALSGILTNVVQEKEDKSLVVSRNYSGPNRRSRNVTYMGSDRRNFH